MLIYAVLGDEYTIEQVGKIDSSFRNNHLLSFYYKGAINNFDVIKRNSKNILIDSGAFSLFSSNKPNDFDDYFKQYLKFVKDKTGEEVIKGFFELDIDSIVGYNKVLEYRQLLEEVSEKIIPVFHLRLGVNEFKKMVHEYDYISIGGIVSKEIDPKHLLPFVQYAHKYNTKIHGLGLTNIKWLKKIPFDSVDSTAWRTVRFAHTIYFDEENVKLIKKDLPSNFVTKNYRAVDLHSYLEFFKFQEYFEKRSF